MHNELDFLRKLSDAVTSLRAAILSSGYVQIACNQAVLADRAGFSFAVREAPAAVAAQAGVAAANAAEHEARTALTSLLTSRIQHTK
jgi:hypothetical protein